jgi:hypothetical protein
MVKIEPDRIPYDSTPLFILQSVDFASPQVIKEAKKYNKMYQINGITLLLKNKIDTYWTKRINKLIKIMDRFGNQKVNLILIPMSLKKMIPNKPNQVIGTNECNSGATISYGQSSKYIIIWREEELEKVLLHELIHYYQLDKAIKGPRDYREAYTETLATLLYTKSLKKECQHSVKTLANLIRYWYGDKYPGHLPPKDIGTKVSDDTSTVGYFLIKAALLFQIEKRKLSKKFKEGVFSGKEYMKLVKESLNDKDYGEKLKEAYDKTKTNPSKSLRMTTPYDNKKSKS